MSRGPSKLRGVATAVGSWWGGCPVEEVFVDADDRCFFNVVVAVVVVNCSNYTSKFLQ